MIADFCSLVKANRGRENRGKEKRINTRAKQGKATNSIARRGQGAIAPCRVQGQRPCWGLGQRPNCWSSDLLQRKSQAWHLGRRQRSVPAHKLPLPQERNPPSAKKVNYGSVRCEGVKGATADFVCSHCPLVASAEAKPSATQKSTCLNPQSRKHHCLLPPRRIFPMQKIPRLSHNRRRKLMQTLLEK
mgnify:FL=1